MIISLNGFPFLSSILNSVSEKVSLLFPRQSTHIHTPTHIQPHIHTYIHTEHTKNLRVDIFLQNIFTALMCRPKMTLEHTAKEFNNKSGYSNAF